MANAPWRAATTPDLPIFIHLHCPHAHKLPCYACACPLCAHALHLLARALPVPARVLRLISRHHVQLRSVPHAQLRSVCQPCRHSQFKRVGRAQVLKRVERALEKEDSNEECEVPHCLRWVGRCSCMFCQIPLHSVTYLCTPYILGPSESPQYIVRRSQVYYLTQVFL